MRYLKAIYFWVFGILLTLILFLILCVVQTFLKLSKAPNDGRFAHKIATIWGRLLIKGMPGWNISVDGKEYLPGDHEPMVIVANHESMADIWAMYFLGIQFRWLSKEAVFKIPFVGRAMRWAGYVPIIRGRRDSHSEAMRESAGRLRMGLSMFFFPEGTRSIDGTIKPFKNGAFKLARDCQVKILPVAIHGAANLMVKGSGMPGCSHVKVKILPPLPPPQENEDLESYSAHTRELIIAAHASLLSPSSSPKAPSLQVGHELPY